jgi:hypothetical protein
MAMAQKQIEFERMYYEDMANARARDIEFLKAGRRNIRADIMVMAAASGLIACLVSLIWFRETIPGEAVGIISTVAGIFGSCLKDAFSFEFGSTQASRDKTDALVSIAASK